MLAPSLAEVVRCHVAYDSFRLKFARPLTAAELDHAINDVRAGKAADPEVDEDALAVLKFSGCLPREISLGILASRIRDDKGVATVLRQPIRFVL